MKTGAASSYVDLPFLCRDPIRPPSESGRDCPLLRARVARSICNCANFLRGRTGPDGLPRALVQRGPSHRAANRSPTVRRSASKKGAWPLPSYQSAPSRSMTI